MLPFQVALPVFLLLAFGTGILADLSTFNQWFQQNGGTAAVQIAEYTQENRGLQCLQALPEDSPVITIPLKLALYASVSHTNPEHRAISTTYKASNDDALIAILLLEKHKVNDSFWKPYIDVFPTLVRNALYFTPAEMDAFQSTDIKSKILARHRDVDKALVVFSSKLPSLSFMPPVITRDEFLWATSIVDSRALRFSGVPHLLPYADMFNFMPHGQVRPADSGSFFLKYHQLSSESVTIRSDRSCVTGEQLYEDYGDSSDDIYLLYHGFVPETNSFRCINVETPKFASSTKEVQDLLSAMEIRSASVSTCVGTSGYIGDKMVVAFATMSMEPTQITQCSETIAANKGDWKTIFAKCGYASVIADVKQHLETSSKDTNGLSPLSARTLALIQKTLPTSTGFQFTTTIADDEDLLRAGTEHSLAVSYRLYSKRLWSSICDKYGAVCSFKANTTKKKSSAKYHTFKSDKKESLKQKLALFNEWFAASTPSVSMVEAAPDSDYRVTVRAKQAIGDGDTYLGVPLKVIMDKSKIDMDDDLGFLFHKIKNSHGAVDAFHKMLFFLIYHRFILGPKSFYWPYLRLLPSLAEMDVPLMWSNETIEDRLYPSALARAVLIENAETTRTFQQLMLVDDLVAFFPKQVLTYELYCWAKNILNSRSIWWNGERHLVPMLDFINHGQGPNPRKVHSTVLDASKAFAITNASWAFPKGEQVFENYGQPNHVYFLYHGFIVKRNFHDCVNVDLQLSPKEIAVLNWEEGEVLTIAQKIYMREFDDVITTCISPMGIDQRAWLFLALKNNNFEQLKQEGKLGKPTIEGLKYFLGIINERLVPYDGYMGKHTAASSFIFEEEALLGTIKDRIVKTIKDHDESVAKKNAPKKKGKGKKEEL